ncbi:FAD-binding protein, partial [Aquicoccus sp. SCR17]|nr:FAD-binding protein [Carideicomes alvinocaridis]
MRPASEAELAEAVRGATGPLAIRGGGTRGMAVDGEVLETLETLETGGLSGIALYEPGALTLVARAGTPVAEIEATLAAEGQRLAFEPMDHRALMGTKGAATIGGVAAANVSGPRRIQVGAARDFLLGLRLVDGRGEVLKNGGRVMKNVTGYDLVRLMAGAHGTLGVLTEVALKVLPRPETEATLRCEGLTPGAAVAAMSRALGSPYEVTGAAHQPGGATLLRLEGFDGSVAYRAGALRDLLGGEWEVVEAEASAGLWRGVRDVAPLAEVAGDVWRVSVRPSDGPAALERLAAEAALMDWGGGLIWAALPAGTDARA